MSNPPSPFIVRWVRRLRLDFPTPGRALDVAAGHGRHTRLLADAGFFAVGVDRNLSALAEARRTDMTGKRCAFVAADLTAIVFPPESFQLVVVSRYLDRRLFGAILTCLVPGGYLVYETFTSRQLALGRGPRSPDHLLNPGELRTLPRAALTADTASGAQRGGGFDILFDEEVTRPNALARLVVRKRPHHRVAGAT